MHTIAMLGTGLIGRFYTMSLQNFRGKDDMAQAIQDSEIDTVIVDMICHCIEIDRNFIGKEIRPVEVTCWVDTQVHPIEVSWTFRGRMDLRDEVAGTDGTVWLNH